jgi:hypothetical protein
MTKIRHWLQATAECVQLKGAGASVRVGMNADRTIDAQIDIANIPNGYPVIRDRSVMGKTVIGDVQECWQNAIEDADVTRDYFGQVGVDTKDAEASGSADRRYRGVNRHISWWFRLSTLVPLFEALRGIARNVQKKRGKPFRVWLRIHWTLLDEKPGTLEKPKGARR